MRPHRPLATLAAALVLASCGGSDEADPELVFVSTRDGEYALFAMSASGDGERRLTEADVEPSSPQALFFQTEPAWSPDGSTIAFASKRAGTFDLYAMDADGSGTRQLTSTSADDVQPAWSPDGERIVFARGTSPRLVVMDADGSAARRLTDDDAEEGEPAWSPDGRSIVYVRRRPGTSIRELWVVRADGTQSRRLTELGGVVQGPAWAPDGRRLAFSSNAGERAYAIHVVGIDGTGVRRLTSGEDAFDPDWSPDGATIAFSRGGAIVAIDVETGDERLLTDPENNDSSPAWRPDSTDDD